MKHEIVITAPGHKGTLERLQNEFTAIRLWEAADGDAALKAAAPRVRALAHFGHAKVDGKLVDTLTSTSGSSNVTARYAAYTAHPIGAISSQKAFFVSAKVRARGRAR